MSYSDIEFIAACREMTVLNKAFAGEPRVGIFCAVQFINRRRVTNIKDTKALIHNRLTIHHRYIKATKMNLSSINLAFQKDQKHRSHDNLPFLPAGVLELARYSS